VVDTNAAFISEAMTTAGARVFWRTTVGDNVDLIVEAMVRAMQRSDIVIATGGLGPTNDDLTKKAICKYFKRQLVFHDDILKRIEDRFRARGLAMPAINQNQALQPQGAELVENEIGSAVGIAFDEDGKLFVALPGVPEEMKLMVSGWVVERIRAKAGNFAVLHRRIKTTGIFESALFEKIANLVENKGGSQAEDKISVAFLPGWRGIEIRLTIATLDESEGRRQIAELEARIAARIGKYIYGYGDDTLPGVAGRILKEKHATLAVAESCTGGLLGKLLTDIPGSSEYFLGGVIAYSNEIKKALLDVSEELLQKYGAVSEQCAIAMAEGARNRLGATVAVSITGVAGPDGGTPDKPVGLVYVGLAAPDISKAVSANIGPVRERNRERSATMALDMVRKYLLGIE